MHQAWTQYAASDSLSRPQHTSPACKCSGLNSKPKIFGLTDAQYIAWHFTSSSRKAHLVLCISQAVTALAQGLRGILAAFQACRTVCLSLGVGCARFCALQPAAGFAGCLGLAPPLKPDWRLWANAKSKRLHTHESPERPLTGAMPARCLGGRQQRRMPRIRWACWAQAAFNMTGQTMHVNGKRPTWRTAGMTADRNMMRHHERVWEPTAKAARGCLS